MNTLVHPSNEYKFNPLAQYTNVCTNILRLEDNKIYGVSTLNQNAVILTESESQNLRIQYTVAHSLKYSN